MALEVRQWIYKDTGITTVAAALFTPDDHWRVTRLGFIFTADATVGNRSLAVFHMGIPVAKWSAAITAGQTAYFVADPTLPVDTIALNPTQNIHRTPMGVVLVEPGRSIGVYEANFVSAAGDTVQFYVEAEVWRT